MKHTEMSNYINVLLYDQHEEMHAYFVDMMAKMISEFQGARRDEFKPCRLLEFGAGTGIFTRRLVGLPHVDVSAVEVDNVCFDRMLVRFREYEDVRMTRRKLDPGIRIELFAFTNGNEAICIEADSRLYDPGGPEVRFDAIFSSFADHHIRPNDKQTYLQNVRKNLRPGSPFIVGDEFLPDYDPGDLVQHEKALYRYHGHIIEIAERQGHKELVKLETEALNSGLKCARNPNLSGELSGDYKLSCLLYEDVLSRAGLGFEKTKIGPLDREDLGGIYVYRIWDPKNM